MSYGQYMAQRKVLGSLGQPELGETIRRCAICGRKIPDNMRKGVKFCSWLCRYEGQKARSRERVRNLRKARATEVRVCPVCGNEFLLGDGHAGRKFCSDACREERHREVDRVQKHKLRMKKEQGEKRC